MSILSLRLQAAHIGGNTRRWHAEDVHGEQTVAAHTWGMLAILFILHPSPSPNLVRAITFHDGSEPYSGDIPFFARRAFPTLQDAEDDIGARWNEVMGLGRTYDLAPVDVWWLRMTDAAEAYFFAKRQLAMGNRLMEGPVLECVSRLEAFRQDEVGPDSRWDIVQAIFDTKIGKRLTRSLLELEALAEVETKHAD